MMQMPSSRLIKASLCGLHPLLRSYTTNSLHSSIIQNTKISQNHLTPEIQLRLITPDCVLWKATEEACPFPNPFWAFYWPGGQAVTRYILDHGRCVEGRHVLDVGCGCGSSAIAASMRGAMSSTANDICPVALEAVGLNAKLNNTKLSTNSRDLIGEDCNQWDTIVLGDMFYDPDFANKIIDWLIRLRKNGKQILLGDPGRLSFLQNPKFNTLVRVKSYELLSHTLVENNGMTEAHVWKFEI